MLHWKVSLREAPNSGGLRAAVTVGNELYSFGGHYRDHINVHVFNTVSLRWRTLPPVSKKRKRGERHLDVPCRRQSHTAVLVEAAIYIWGGVNMDYELCSNVLYAFDVDAHTWFKPMMSGTVPQRREGHSACVLGKVMFIHGGYTDLTGWTNAIYKLDTTTVVWSLINTRGTPPPASYCHSATIIGTKMFVFGGWGDQGGRYRYYNTIRVFDTETNCWMNTPSTQLLPEGRWVNSAFTYNGELYIFGGENAKSLKDLWKFSPETFSWKEVKPKGNDPLRMTSGCCCMMGDHVILFGGRRSDELFILDLSPSLKTICKLAVIQYGLEQSELPHNIRWELAAITDLED